MGSLWAIMLDLYSLIFKKKLAFLKEQDFIQTLKELFSGFFTKANFKTVTVGICSFWETN